MKILPAIFEQRAAERIDTSIWEAQMCSIPGGATLLKATLASGSGPAVPTIAYQVPDENRDLAAAEMLANNQIEIPSLSETGLTFVCHSSLALAFENNPTSYTVTLGFDGSATCECLDFVTRGGACKHIRGAVLRLNVLRANGLNLPAIQLPSSIEDARALQARQLVSNQNLSTAVAHHNPIEKAAIATEDALRESDDAYMVEPEVEERSADRTARITARGELEGADEDSDDDESIATDTPDDESNEFDFTSIRGVSKSTLDEQTIARVFYELEGAAPKLGELSIYLKQCTSLRQPQDRDRASAFHETLNCLQGELSRLINGYGMTGSIAGPSHPSPSSPLVTSPLPPVTQPSASQTRGHKRTVLDIIGASPEKASKRKQSYKPF